MSGGTRGLAAGAITAAATLGGATLLVQGRADARRIATDPELAKLEAPLVGRPTIVRSSDGTHLHAEVFGADHAPTIVLAHGWMCALRIWSYEIRELAADFRIVAYDQRGHGRSAAGAGGDYSIDAFAQDLGAVLAACVPAGERAVLAGHSMGAMTIAAWAARRPEEVPRRASAVALLSTGFGDLISETLLLRAPTRLASVKGAVGRAVLCSDLPLSPMRGPVTHRAVRYIALSPSATPAQVAFCEEMVLGCHPKTRGGCGDSLSRLELYHAIEHLDLPATVIAGGRDRLTPLVHSRRLAEALPRLNDFVEVPEAGHMTPIEAHQEVSERLRALSGP